MFMLLAIACGRPTDVPVKTDSDGAVETGDSQVETGTSDSPPPDSDSTTDSPTDSDSGGWETAADSDTGVEAAECDRAQPWIWVAAGMAQTCGIHSNGCAECWGLGEDDALPYQTCTYCYYGEDKPPAGTYSRIEMFGDGIGWDGLLHTCGVSEEEGLHCWGANYVGESDVGVMDARDFAVGEYLTYWIDAKGAVSGAGDSVALPPDGEYVDIAVGNGTAVVRAADGTTTQWPIHNEDVEWVKTLDSTFDTIDLKVYGCGTQTDDTIRCWNPEDPNGEFESELATEVPGGTYSSVCVTSGASACALDTAGLVECWGVGASDFLVAPTDVTFTQIACGNSHACGITTDGDLRCWGYDEYGETVTPT